MDNVKEIFSDGISQIKLAAGMIRFELVSLNSSEDKPNELVPRITHRVIMTPDGFLSTFNSMQTLVNKMVDAKILSKEAVKTESTPEVTTETETEA